MNKKDPVIALADNIRRLMADRQESQKTVATRASLSQRAVGDLLTYGKVHFKSPTVRTVDALSRAFEVPSWKLMIPDMSLDLLTSSRMDELIANYRDASIEGRNAIERVADGEVRYAAAARKQPHVSVTK